MAVREYLDDSDGLFGTRTRTSFDGDDIGLGFAEAWRRSQPEATFDVVERAVQEGLQCPHTPKGKDARFVQVLFKNVRERIASSASPDDAAFLARNAIWIGQTIMKMLLRTRHELDAERGVKTVRSAAEGHAVTHGTSEEKRARWSEYCLCWDKVRAEQPHMSKRAIDELVATEFRCSSKTIQRARSRRDQSGEI